MANYRFMAGAAALAVGSLLIIGAGCGTQGASAAQARTIGSPSSATDAAADVTGAREITVTASSFAFSPSEITVKKGEKIKLTLVNGDGRHGIAIPAFNVNIRPPAGGSASAVFTADQQGTFPFFCNVFCGSGHRDMHGALIVE